MNIEQLKDQIDSLANEAYTDGWNDCLLHLAKQSFSPARTQQLEKNFKELNLKFRLQEKKLRLAVRLLRHAQRSECGQLGQYDRFFDEGYHEGIDEYI